MQTPSRRQLLAGGGGLLALALVLVVVLVASSGDGESTQPTRTTSTTSITTTSATTSTTAPLQGPPAPLTGLQIRRPELLDRPALVVKIDNTNPIARPQVGLLEADIVYEERIEGGSARIAAVFHSRDALSIGPVRSGRSTDLDLVANLNTPLFAYSGANQVFLSMIRAGPLVDVGADWHIERYFRRADQAAPYNLYSSTSSLYAVPSSSGPPQPQFTFRADDAELAPDAVRVAQVEYSFGGAVTAVFAWDAEARAWQRTHNGTIHVDELGEALGPQNVIMQFVRYHDTGLVDVAGAPVPEAELLGSGEAWVFTAGHRVVGEWSRAASVDPTTFTTPDGERIDLTPGQTWIVLIESGRATSASCAAVPAHPGCVD